MMLARPGAVIPAMPGTPSSLWTREEQSQHPWQAVLIRPWAQRAAMPCLRGVTTLIMGDSQARRLHRRGPFVANAAIIGRGSATLPDLARFVQSACVSGCPANMCGQTIKTVLLIGGSSFIHCTADHVIDQAEWLEHVDTVLAQLRRRFPSARIGVTMVSTAKWSPRALTDFQLQSNGQMRAMCESQNHNFISVSSLARDLVHIRDGCVWLDMCVPTVDYGPIYSRDAEIQAWRSWLAQAVPRNQRIDIGPAELAVPPAVPQGLVPRRRPLGPRDIVPVRTIGSVYSKPPCSENWMIFCTVCV